VNVPDKSDRAWQATRGQEARLWEHALLQDELFVGLWVEVAGEEPELTLDELALVQGLAFAPWVDKKGEIVRNFRADSISVLADARRTSAA
jgi:hypothetical protein